MVAFSELVAKEFCPALEKQVKYIKIALLSDQVREGILYQPKPLALRRDTAENLPKLHMRYSQIEVPLKLFFQRIIVRVIYLCLRHIGNAITCLDQP